MMEYVDDTAAKIMLAARPGDSIRRVAQKIDGSYSWVYDWIERLEAAGFLRRDDGIYIEDYTVRDRYHELVAAIARATPPTIDDAYIIPHFAGLPFAYTKIDSVYVWTHGGYQIARGHDDYPIFIQVSEHDRGTAGGDRRRHDDLVRVVSDDRHGHTGVGRRQPGHPVGRHDRAYA